MADSPSIEELFERFRTFTENTFLDSKAEDYLVKLQEESKELVENPNMEELADCMLVLVGLSQFIDGDLKQALEAKIVKNENRKWERQPDGTYHHV